MNQEVGRAFVTNLKDGLLQLRRATIVALPSVSYRLLATAESAGTHHLEERMLFLLFLLREPGVKIVYVSSFPFQPEVVDYYLDLVGCSGASRDRLVMLSLDDPRPWTLSSKLLANPAAMGRLKALLRDDADAFLLPFRGTAWDVLLAEELGIPRYSPEPRGLQFGTKSGSRTAARRAGLPVVHGSEDLGSPEDVERALTRLAGDRPDAEAFVIKLNEGIGGQGNAILERSGLRSPIGQSEAVLCALYESWPQFLERTLEQGAVVEELIRRPGISSPSVQLELRPNGAVQTLSTHEQILVGPDSQVYQGCRFPARAQHRDTIQEFGERIGSLMAAEGVLGMVSVDMLVVPAAGGVEYFLCEINLRMGGTSFPYFATSLATGATYDRSSSELRIGDIPKFYTASDEVVSDNLVGLTPRDVIRALENRGLAYNRNRRSGTILSLIGALEAYGRIGLTCVGGSKEEADLMYEEALSVIRSLSRSPGRSGLEIRLVS